jgi:cytosine/adenosine deaminase-related metal-dependent hydrolase
VRRQYAERRVGGDVVHVEVSPGVVVVVAAWMLDPAACAGMGFGAPRVAIPGLVELHHLLIERGFRRSSRDDPTIVQEEQNETVNRRPKVDRDRRSKVDHTAG